MKGRCRLEKEREEEDKGEGQDWDGGESQLSMAIPSGGSVSGPPASPLLAFGPDLRFSHLPLFSLVDFLTASQNVLFEFRYLHVLLLTFFRARYESSLNLAL